MKDLSTLRHEVEAHEWYHTLELAPGVVTPGWFDTRAVVDQLPIPSSLAGQRCLDIGTFDGFWAYEMERRGGEVVAVDIVDPELWDWPVGSQDQVKEAVARRKAGGKGFELAHEALRSSVVRELTSVYDLDPQRHGQFDFIYLGSLLLHLRDPIRALERARSVCRGRTLVVDAVDLTLSMRMPGRPAASLDGVGRPWWWKPSTAGLVRMVEAAGFDVVQKPRRLFMPPGDGQPLPAVTPRSLLTPAGRSVALLHWRGDPHLAVLAQPRR